MKNILNIASVILFSLLIAVSCKKSAGPKGDTGATGAQGPAGSASSNMQVQTFTTSTSSWTSYNWPYEYVETVLSVPAITSTVVSNGDVRVYVLDPSGTSWMGMPYSFLAYQYNYKYKTGQVIIDYTIYTGGAPVNPGAQQFKVVIVPPGLTKKNPNINWNNYNEVKSKLNLLD